MSRTSASSLALLVPLTLLLAGGCGEQSAAPVPADVTTTDEVRRLAGMLDYVAADYPGTVKDGQLTAAGKAGEYDEQLVFLKDADAIAEELPAPGSGTPVPLAEGIEAIRQSVKEKAPGEVVTDKARGLRAKLLEAYGVVLAPAAVPSFDVGRELYVTCVNCHGAEGAGDGEIAHTMDPPPRDFTDAEILAEMSPVRAFNAITDGVEGTKMESYGTMSPSQRWSLAFYVFTFRHDEAAAERGKEAFEKAGKPIAATPSRLANQTDGQILAAMTGAGLSDTEAMDALAYLRREAAFRTTGAPLDPARKRLAAAVTAYRDGRPGDARREAAAAYLDGFEPHEASLATHDDQMVVTLEREFLELREAIAAGAPAEEIEQRALRIGALLDQADELLQGGSGVSAAMVASLAIILREGLEGALLVLLLLGLARRSGAADEDARAVHYGWLAAVGLGVVTWFASSAVIGALGGAQRELIEGIVALLAAVVLLSVSHFVLARLDAQRRVAALKEKLEAAVSSPRRKLVLASLAFVAVYREAFETVLFLQAIMLDAGTSGWAVLAGVGLGVAVLVAVVIAMRRVGKRLRPGPLLTALGALLCLLSVALAGKGVRSLQEAGVIGITPTGGPRFDWLGLYPTQETVIAQVAVLAVFAGLATWAILKNRGARAADQAAAGA